MNEKRKNATYAIHAIKHTKTIGITGGLPHLHSIFQIRNLLVLPKECLIPLRLSAVGKVASISQLWVHKYHENYYNKFY
ncbi:hypothetical protein C0134_04760 [Moraxella catarrhalis]|jgi:hypothetical protein|nr:hypothetical protein A6J52_01150 [Moraxella catarrhalis]ARE65326.1 hypothetical protein MC195_00545 [Moraxella catarrhalis]AVL50095.1 hypothetical protein CEP83_03305 [Moraxella catarrhalis]MPW46669.1 hypothetical protein [Moraxella catarrhalis]MPW48244.1 hypothetical protein [Moraxella catarrhalis]